MTQYRSRSLGFRIAGYVNRLRSRLSHGAFEGNRTFGESWEGYSRFMEVFAVRGWTKFSFTVLSEGVTLGLAGLIFMLALALPAFREVEDDNWLKKQDLSVTFLDRYGNLIGRRGILHDNSLALDDLPEFVIRAALATEDRRFFDHYGIDPIGIVRALASNARSESEVQGGSTITQQLAKNLFLTNERSIERKIKEAFLALWLEQRLTKQEILSLYLDRAYMGGGVFGIQAAAQFYFGKNVQDVTLAEAAMLAGLFKAPTKFAPHINLPAARARANDVLNNMVEAGFLTENQILAAKRNPATAIANGDSESPDYYLDYAFQEMKKLAAGGKFGNETALVVKTSFDPDIQRQTDVAMEQTIREEGESRNISQGAAVIMEPDGAIRALYGGRDYGESQFNRATNALRQPGSSFKPYVYAAALNTGQFEPETRVSDRRTCIGDWCPQNYTKSYSGQMSLSTALARSINTIPVQLTTAIGNGSNRNGRTILIDMVHRLGIDTNIVSVPSLPLGSTELTVLDQATGFSVFANGGQKMGNYAAVEVRDLKGTLIYTHDKDGVRPEKVLSTDIVGKLNRMMSRVVSEGTGTRARLPGLVAAGKTGSTSSYKDIWFVGYTAQMVGAVWFGNDDTSPMREGTTGGLIAAPTWRMIMEFAHEGRPVKPLPGFESGADTLSAPKPEKAPAGEGIVAVSRAPTMSRRSADAIVALDGLLRDGIVRSTGGVQTIAKPDNAILGITPIEPLQR